MIEDLIANVTAGKVIAWSVVAFVIFLIAYDKYLDRRISRLGAHPPVIRSYLPLGADFIYKAMKLARQRRDLDLWTDIIYSTPHDFPGPAKTLELPLRCVGRSMLTVDPVNIKAILTGQFADYGKGWKFHKEWKEFLGDSIFATDGELWSQSRHLLRPMFVRDRIVDTEIFEKHIEKLIPFLEGSPKKNNVVDIGPLFFRFTLDAATDYLLGQSVDSLDNPKTIFATSFQYVLHRQSTYTRAGPLSPFMSRREFRKNLKKMDDFMLPFIEQALSLTPEELDSKLSKNDTFLHALARFTRDPTVLRDQLVAVLLAGRDTTAATLAFCLFELSRNPDVVKKLRAEILTHCDKRKPTYGELKQMKYLNAVIQEAMRLYPVVPFNIRHSLKDTTLPRGGGKDGMSPVGVPADTRIVYSTMVMQRSRDLYDPPPTPDEPERKVPYFDPMLYIPDRWVSGWQPKPWQFIPFNGGPRICLGQQFAMIEMGYTITRILQHFSEIQGVRCPPPGTDPEFKFDVTLSPGEELNCVFAKDT